MKKFLLKCLPATLLILSGCVNVDYVGQCFDPIPEEEPVVCYANRGEIPPGKYRIIGRAKISTTRRLDKYDIQELLIDEARKRGANAAALVDARRELVGIYDREPGSSVGDISHRSNTANNLDDSPRTVTSLGNPEPAELYGEEHFRSELHLRVLFLKEREDLEQQLARRGRELDRLVKQPDPAAPAKKTAPAGANADTEPNRTR